MNGGSAFAIWPFNRYRRIELSAGVVDFDEEFSDPSLEQYSQDYQEQVYGQQLFHNGTAVPLGLSYVQETTVFREFGPLSGNTMKLSYEIAPKIGNTLSRQTVDRRPSVLQAARRLRPAGAARARVQELGRRAELQLLRRQRRSARLRVPAVRRQQHVLRQRRAALPADRGDADADWHPGRRPRRVLRRRRRRLLQQLELQVLGQQHHQLHADHRVSTSTRQPAQYMPIAGPPC